MWGKKKKALSKSEDDKKSKYEEKDKKQFRQGSKYAFGH